MTSPVWDFMVATWRDHVMVFAISAWSGGVTSMHRVMSRKTRFSVIALAVDTLFSGLAGVLTGWACHSMSMGPAATLAAAGVAGHSAPRTLWLLERKLHRWLGVNGNDEETLVDPGKPAD